MCSRRKCGAAVCPPKARGVGWGELGGMECPNPSNRTLADSPGAKDYSKTSKLGPDLPLGVHDQPQHPEIEANPFTLLMGPNQRKPGITHTRKPHGQEGGRVNRTHGIVAGELAHTARKAFAVTAHSARARMHQGALCVHHTTAERWGEEGPLAVPIHENPMRAAGRSHTRDHSLALKSLFAVAMVPCSLFPEGY